MRGVLARPGVYDRYQRWLGEPKVRSLFVEDYLRPFPGAVVLDIGCGTAEILDSLGDVEYIGFDPSDRYVDTARRRFGDRGRFFVAGIEDVHPTDLPAADLVIAFGVVHHLDDAMARHLFLLASRVMGERGRCVTLDPFLEENQSRIERLMIRCDRGQMVRPVDDYLALARTAFPHVRTHVHPGMLRLPFRHTHRIVESANVPFGSPESPLRDVTASSSQPREALSSVERFPAQ